MGSSPPGSAADMTQYSNSSNPSTLLRTLLGNPGSGYIRGLGTQGQDPTIAMQDSSLGQDSSASPSATFGSSTPLTTQPQQQPPTPNLPNTPIRQPVMGTGSTSALPTGLPDFASGLSSFNTALQPSGTFGQPQPGMSSYSPSSQFSAPINFSANPTAGTTFGTSPSVAAIIAALTGNQGG